MKVLNLRCAGGHSFEGWFGSEADYLDQQQRHLLSCPVCGEVTIQRMPSAPRLNLSHAREPKASQAAAPQSSPPAPSAPPAARPAPTDVAPPGPNPEALQTLQALQGAWLQVVSEVVRRTEDVGERFPEEVRRMHYGETAERPIRGQASAQEREALAEEGIEVVSLPVPQGLDGPQH